MKFPNYTHTEVEPKVLEYWQHNKIVEKLRKKYEKGPKFYFLDGPPYTSGRFHLAHAWNYSLKDFILRYKRAQGNHVWDRNGFDMHGLPTEHKVIEKFNLQTKEEIKKFGVDKFVAECETYCQEMAKIMTKDLQRMGVSFDVSDPYMPIKSEFMEGEWQLIKKAHEQDLLYFGEKVITWCEFCETALAKHECEYENRLEDSIFIKFPVKGKKKEYLIAWTTTPWTIPYNLAIMVNPELDYLKAEISDPTGKDKSKEVWYLSKALAGAVVQAVAGKKMKIIEEFKGKKLEGLEYVHPLEKEISLFSELKKKSKNVHTVIMSEQYVDTSAGTGLVHCAPGCGPEDQEACKPYKIPAFNNLKENGFFPDGMGKFSGWRAKVDDAKFIEALKETGCIIAVTDVEHEYPHCWRCHKPVVFRMTHQWFLKTEAIKEKIIKGNQKVHWVPESANNAYESWVKNLRDNSVSRQRFWGTPIPIWTCKKCKEIKVIGSRKEIEENGGKVPENLHIPWIDAVTLKCKCGEMMHRCPDIIDVWVDSGTTSWNCLNNDPKLIKEWYPADAILEAKEQTRLWFSMLSICSYIYFGKNAFQNVYVHGMLNDIEGKKMSKSLGNIVSPYELIDKHGADILRYYMCQNNAGVDINFSWEEAATKARYLQILWNVHKLLINLAKENKVNPFELKKEMMYNLMSVEEKYIISRLNSTIKRVTELFEEYRLDETIKPLEELYLELSRTYIQMVRDKSAIGEDQEKEVVMYTMATVLLNFLKMFNIICPFISEAIYLNLQEEFGLKEEGVSHFAWPKAEEKYIDTKLEESMTLAQNVMQAVLNAREKAKLGLRWPVKEIIIIANKPEVNYAVKIMNEVLKTQLNSKEVKIVEKLPGLKLKIRPDGSKIGPAFGSVSGQVIAKLTIDSPETILGHIEKENSYNFEIDGKQIKVTREMLHLEREVPKDYQEADFGAGFVYVSLIRTPELEAEGFAREIMRNVQQLRKESGLEKLDRIKLHLKANTEMQKQLLKFKVDIEEKVGAEKLEFVAKALTFHSEFKIKNDQFEAWLEKV
ncbi:MAG: isoleucine--tRNA ligase [Nanoarchaeota archaeon]